MLAKTGHPAQNLQNPDGRMLPETGMALQNLQNLQNRIAISGLRAHPGPTPVRATGPNLWHCGR